MPMLAVPGELPRSGGWAYEFTWAGVRAIGSIFDGRFRLYSRGGVEITVTYPELGQLRGLARQAVLDGEIIASGADGRPSLTSLVSRMHVRDPAHAARLAETVPVTYMIFDLLRLDGVDWTSRGYAQRRAALGWLTSGGPHWLVPPAFVDGPATFAAAVGHGLDGVVAKRLDAPYRPGQRSATWIKVKGVPTPAG